MKIAHEPPGSWSGSALVTRAGELVHDLSVGCTAGSGSAPCTPTTRFQAGSISKQVMSVAVLALSRRGELQLDEPIDRWLPDLPALLRPITLAQLLSHTSGLGHWGHVTGGAVLPSDPPDHDTLVALTTGAPLLSAPGDRWRYSGPGFLLVAQVVEAATTSPYGRLAAELVLSRAAMAATTSGEFPIGGPDVAVGHRDGQQVDVGEGFSRLPGTGDLWTTTADLLRYSQALRHGELIEPAAASRLWSGQIELDPADPPDRPTAASAYGYGTFLGQVAGHRAWYVPGDNPGYQSLLAHLPDLDVDVVILANAEDAVDAALEQLELRA